MMAYGRSIFSADAKERIRRGGGCGWFLSGNVVTIPFPGAYLQAAAVELPDKGDSFLIRGPVRFYSGPLILHAGDGVLDRKDKDLFFSSGILYLAGSSWWGVPVQGIRVGAFVCEFTAEGKAVRLSLSSGTPLSRGKS